MKLLRHPREFNPFIRMVHVLLLLGWLLSSHGIAPAICMMAAVIDGEHAVKVGATCEGAMTVVLSHAGKSAAELITHEHDALCKVLVAFAEAPTPGAPDHVLAFKPVDDASSTQRLLSSPQSLAKTAAPLFILSFNRPQAPVVRIADRRAWSQGLALKTGRTVMRC